MKSCLSVFHDQHRLKLSSCNNADRTQNQCRESDCTGSPTVLNLLIENNHTCVDLSGVVFVIFGLKAHNIVGFGLQSFS